MIYATESDIFSDMENLTINIPYQVAETGETVYIPTNAQEALDECQAEINKWAAIISRIEAGL